MSVHIEKAKDGHDVPVVECEGKLIHLGSMYDGREAARVWCDKNLSPDKENLILIGMGDGQIALEARNRLKNHIFVYEPEKDIFDFTKTSKIYKKLIKLGNVEVSKDSEMLENWMAKLFNEDTLETMALLIHPGYRTGIWNEEIDEISENLNDKLKEMIDYRKSLIVIAMKMCTNIINNLPKMKGAVLLSKLQGIWNQQLPFIIVGAGPSLKKNVDQLKKVGDKACILCLDTAYPILRENGVRPHMIATIDAGKPLEVFGDMNDWDDVPIAIISSARTEIIERTKGPIIWCGEPTGYARGIRGEVGDDECLFPLAYGVSSLGLSIPISLGASQIVFVGMDMAFSPDGKSHAGVFSNDMNILDIDTVEGYYGGIVKTRKDWKDMREWIERIAEDDNYGRYINATEGGCRMKGVPQMSLEQVVGYLRDPEDDWYSLLSGDEARLSDDEYEQIMERYLKSFEDFWDIREVTYEDVFYNSACGDKPIYHLIMSFMKSRPEETRKERFDKSMEVLEEIITKKQKEIAL